MSDLCQANVPDGHAGDDGVTYDEGPEHNVSHPRVDTAHLDLMQRKECVEYRSTAMTI
jgi:hypothetical protein